MAHIREAITSGDLADLVSSGASATVYPSDDTVLQVLQSRFRADLPCARAGATNYIVVNPLKTLANVNDASAKDYEERCYKDTTVFATADMPRPLQPHMYELAARMYLMMRRRSDSQVALFQGVTGSGKSSSCSLLINQVLRLSAKSKKEHRLAEQIQAFRTILDSFGNAKTVMNPSASRHSRYYELHFNEKGRISAGKVLGFALDKSRLVRLSQEERSYHIFYQLLAGATPAEQDQFNLEDPSEYALLASSGCYRLPGGPFSDDSLAMEELRAAMRLLGFKPKHVQSIFSLLVAILLLGNLTFLESPAREESASIANRPVLEQVSRLLGVDPEDLAQVLTNRTSYVRKELYTVLLNAEQARQQRDTMVQALYSILFAFMVETANHKIAPGDKPTTIMAFIDTPGSQSRNSSGSVSINPLIAAQGHGAFEDFSINFANELVHSYIVYNTFEDRVGYNSHMVSDGVNLAEIATMDNSGCVELLKGLPVPDKIQKRPDGLLGAMHKASTNHKAGKGALDEDLITDMVAKCGTHDSFVTSPTLAAAGSAETNLRLFGVNHYTGSVTYDVTGFVEKNADLVDPALVTLLRDSQDVFVAKLVSGPTIATETHSKDESIVVQAQVSVRPLRMQEQLPSSNGSGPSLDNLPQLDASKCYPVTSQINYTLSSLLTSIDSAKLWCVSCIRPNDSGSPNSFDKRRVKMQIRSLLIPDIIARRKVEFVADYTHDAFCDRYVPTMQGTTTERIRQCSQANGWRNGQDFAVGHRSVWLTYEAWKMAEDVLREGDTKVSPEDDESVAPHAASGEIDDDVQSAYMNVYKNGNPFDESQDNLLLTRTAADGERIQAPNNPFSNAYGVGGLRSPNSAQLPGASHDDESAWGSEWDKKRDLPHGDTGAEKPVGIVKKETEMNTVEEVPTSKSRRWWLRLVWLTTWWIPNFLLIYVGRMKRPDIRLAWREKVTICFLIFLMCGIVIFYIVVFGRLLCPQFDKAWLPKEVAQHTGDNDFWVAIQGEVYDISSFWRAQHSDTNIPVTRGVMEEIAGQDLTNYFPPPLVLACPTVSDPKLAIEYRNFTPVDPSVVHTSGFLQTTTASKLHDDNWYTNTLRPALKQWHKGPLVWDAGEIKTTGQNGTRTWAVWDNELYDLTDYFWTIQQNPAAKDTFTYLNETLTDLWQQQPGEDISTAVNALLATMSAEDAAKQNTCLKNVFRIGSTDFRKTPRCQVQNWLLLAFSIVLVTTIAAKFLAALQLTGKRMPEMLDKFVICQVPCYTEGEESLRRTIDSLAGLKYDDKRKLLFIICDGNIIGTGNDRPTPRIVLDILGVDPKLDPEPLLFKSVGEGSQQLNYGKVYSGLYEFEGHVVPYMVVVKVGKPSERSRPGNRGKRDSQVLMMHYLNRVHFDAPMNPLELEIYHQMRNVIGIDPAFYEYIFTVDADTSVTPDSLNRLVACTADDSKVIGICGETKVDNEEGSWWTMIQVYEYYISHHLAKAFESLFGSVTCLPGCFSMYRIRTADKGRPIIISSRVIDEYAENNVDTLHKKNLLSLGEDRYLTTLLMKNFPTYKMKFTPDAVAHTVAPDRWTILLSQRRRWINSTIHNLCELVFLPELCGFCCFSMRFIVFLDLLGTIILPATTVYLVYLIVTVSSGKAAIPTFSLIMIGAVYGLQAIIFILKREFMLVGWMVVYILSYPVYSFFLPIYSFWRMDDFSWGNTRLVIGEGNNKRVIVNDELKFDESMIPLKKFSEYEAEAWDTGTQRDIQEQHSDDSRSIAASRKSRSHAPRSIPPRSASPNTYHPASQSGDYYRDTNLTHNSSSNPNIPRLPSIQSMSQTGGSGPLHSQSFLGPTFPPGPGSVASSGMGQPMLPPMGFPSGQPLYPLGMGVPGAPRNTVMSGLDMFAGTPGSPAGSFGLPPPATRMSTMSFATNLNPYADKTSTSTDPTDEELLSVLKAYLASQDLMTVTKKTAREAVTKHFPNADLSSKKDFLNKSIDDILAQG